MINNLTKAAAIIILSALLTACSINTEAKTANQVKQEESNIQNISQNVAEKIEDKPDNSSIIPNEAGKIMILMYHDIGQREGEWVRTPENFRKDLQTLYDKGYRLISVKDYINGNINVPKGTTPVIITFDDGTLGQFNMIKTNEGYTVDPNCAVGILEDFNKKHPDFGQKATFYVYYPVPFRQKDLIDLKFKHLTNDGMDIGNHTFSHENLRNLSKEDIQKALGKNVLETKKYLPDYEVDSLALPYGIKPKLENLKQYVVRGEYSDIKYENKAVLLVGSNPAYPIYSTKTKTDAIPRIRASEMNTSGTGLYDWLEYFDKHPKERYISDGDVNTISIPIDKEKEINKDKLNSKEVILIK
ncbi:Polysaccharide deacetylase [Caloramator quimbayensis]|uniref:Polysaccharide deacetylase n=1 Tax=Caloramator quimbayensis TaxID=1147123 RepID=A0A1T4X5R8_9CLOT|nr:polysaccharide deacetylase family protein [Caloramator quimbayensis]SKA84769.1 Polysaccharide deacetylase [Caloramator quimbayensis]